MSLLNPGDSPGLPCIPCGPKVFTVTTLVVPCVTVTGVLVTLVLILVLLWGVIVTLLSVFEIVTLLARLRYCSYFFI